MMQFIAANMAPIMFVSLIVFLLFGYSVAFALGACGLFFGIVGVQMGLMPETLLQALPLRIFGIMQNDTLLAVPFFTLMGLILERSGMAEDLLDTIGQVFGPIRGGLAYAVILVGAMLAATTGVVAASVISMGLISLPIMLRYGYDRRLASGVIAASGTLAQIIPAVAGPDRPRRPARPQRRRSLQGCVHSGLHAHRPLRPVRAGRQHCPARNGRPRCRRRRERSARRTARAACRSLLAVIVLSVTAALVFARTRPGSTPTDELIVVSMCVGVVVAFLLAVANRVLKLGQLSKMAERVTFVLIPPLGLIFLVLGTIFLGVATPTEGGAMGATGALVMALVRRRMDLKLLRQAMDTTMKISSFVLFILIGSTVFSLSFQAVDGPVWVEHLLTSLPGGQLGFLIVVNILIFFLAFFLDFFELSFIVIPLIGPVADKLGIDLVWFGVLLAVNMQTSFMHPPFGFALFYLRSVAPADDYDDKITSNRIPRVTTGQIYWGAVPFVLIQIVMVGLIIAFPGLVTGSLTKGPTIDVDKAFQQMQMAPQPSYDSTPSAPSTGASDASAPAGSAPAVPEAVPAEDASKSDDDAMKRLLESARKDAPKKP